ncbi:MAG: UbiA family prenyltransferase [Candidatus Thorarchaeota archaeon]
MQDTLLYRLRVPNIVGTSLLALTGFVLALRQPSNFNLGGAILIFLSMVFFNIYIWISNDYYDAPFDAADEYKKSRNVFCNDPETREYKIGNFFIWFSLITGLICGFFAGILYFLFTLAGMLLAFLYNSPVFRAKSRIAFDWIFHVVWFQITFLPLYLYIFGLKVIWGFERENIQFYGVFLYISVFSLLAQINHQIPDYEIDLQTKQRTTVVALGVENTINLRYIFYILISSAVLVICLINGTYIALILMVGYTLYLLKTDRTKAADAPLPWLYFFIIDYIIISPLLIAILEYL